MSAPESQARVEAVADGVARLRAALEPALSTGTVEALPDETVQELLVLAVKAYVAKRQAGVDLPAFTDDALTATEVSIVTLALLDAATLEPFELTLWGGWGRA